jgi:hypothetical protein
MTEYKINYPDKAAGVADLKSKYVIDADEKTIFGTVAVVHVGKIANKEGHQIDIMTERTLVFEANMIVAEINHKFAK